MLKFFRRIRRKLLDGKKTGPGGEIFRDPAYQKLIVENHTHLLILVGEGEQLLKAFDQIIAQLEAEIATK